MNLTQAHIEIAEKAFTRVFSDCTEHTAYHRTPPQHMHLFLYTARQLAENELLKYYATQKRCKVCSSKMFLVSKIPNSDKVKAKRASIFTLKNVNLEQHADKPVT